MPRYLLITGTDTGVGKTVFTAAFTGWLRAHGRSALALKPLASGDREDARQLEKVQAGALELDWINPWSFAEPVSPLLAARAEGRRVTVDAWLRHVRATAALGSPVLVEAAGGLLSPLLEGADAPELIMALGAIPVVVASNRLGVVNQVRLTWSALPGSSRRLTQVILMDPETPDRSTASNLELVREYLPSGQVWAFPRFRQSWSRKEREARSAPVLEKIAARLGI
jgi:dethiobiotin synthetase